MDRSSPIVVELRAAMERIQVLENELKSAKRYHTSEREEMRYHSSKSEEEFRKLDEALEAYKRRNRELLEQLAFLEKELELSKQKPRARTPLPLDKLNKSFSNEKPRGKSSLRGSRLNSRASVQNSQNDRVDTQNSIAEGFKTQGNEYDEKELMMKQEIQTIQQERDLFKVY